MNYSMKFALLAALLFRVANAAWDDVEVILTKMESVVQGLRDELETAYTARCDSDTLEQCANNNFHNCASMFVSPSCNSNPDFVGGLHSLCQCGVTWDTNTTAVSTPKPLVGANAAPHNEELIETACYTRLAERFMVKSYHDELWDEYNVKLSSLHFGSNDGVFRRLPAEHSEECGWFDPRIRPWYTTPSSVPQDTVLVMDLSQSMNNERLLIAKEAATTIINTLPVSSRVAVVTFASDADVLLGGNVLIEAIAENKEQLVKAIEKLEPSNGTSNLYNAFNLTFGMLSNSMASENSSSRCNSAIILLSDGHVDDGQSEDETNMVVSFVEEQKERLSADFSKRTFVFTYTVGEDADISFAKHFACSTGGIWRHIGDDETEDIVSALSSYNKLFSMGLANEHQGRNVSWIDLHFSKLINRWLVTAAVPVFDRSVTPYLLLGVAGTGTDLDSLERIHGENTTKELYQKWIMKSSIEGCPSIEPNECQLEALRFLGGGENATCGVCNNTRPDASIVPEICPSNASLSIDLWHNIDYHEVEFSERGCCENNETLSSESACPSPESSNSGVEAKMLVGVVSSLLASLMLQLFFID